MIGDANTFVKRSCRSNRDFAGPQGARPAFRNVAFPLRKRPSKGVESFRGAVKLGEDEFLNEAFRNEPERFGPE